MGSWAAPPAIPGNLYINRRLCRLLGVANSNSRTQLWDVVENKETNHARGKMLGGIWGDQEAHSCVTGVSAAEAG